MRHVLPLVEVEFPFHAGHRQGLKGLRCSLLLVKQPFLPTSPFFRTMFFRLSFVTLIVAAVALGTPVKRDEAKVRLDLEALYKQLQALDTSVKAFPNEGATLAEVYVSVPSGSLPSYCITSET